MKIVIVLAAIALSLIFNPLPADATTMSSLAASTPAGTFAELTGMTNWSSGNIMAPCSAGNFVTQYANKAVWNPVGKRFQFVGSPHAGCSGTNVGGVYYDDATNTWGTLPVPNNSINQPQHSYDHNTINPATGRHYYKHYDSTGMQGLDDGAGSWTNFASVPMSSKQCCTALAWFPDFSGGRLIWVDGDWGVWSWTPGTPGTWTELYQGNGSDGSGLTHLTMAGYNVYAHYSALCSCVILGGGSGLYKLNSSGVASSMSLSGGPSAPFVGPGGDSIVVDPATGYILFLNNSGMWQLNPSTGAWNTVSVSVPSFFTSAGSVAESLISAPISDYGVVMYVKCDDSSTCRVWLYKHSGSSSPGDTTNPTVSITAPANAATISGTNVTFSATASDNVAVGGVQFKVDGVNVGAEDTTAAYSVMLNSTSYTNGSHTLTAVARDTSNNTATANITVTVSNSAPVKEDFATRCAHVQVVRCIGFDSAAEIAGQYGDNTGIFSGHTTPGLDASIKASGASSIKFTILTNSPSDTSGSYFANFSTDLATQFGASSEFWIQWRQRFSTEFLATAYANEDAWKLAIVGTGDKVGTLYSSCTDLEIVLQSYGRSAIGSASSPNQFPIVYNSCSGSTSHGGFDPFFEGPLAGADFKLQNGRPSPFCLYSQGGTSPVTFLPPNGNCYGYFANEWMTFQLHVITGARVADEFSNSHVDLYIARDGGTADQVLNWGPYNLSAGSAGLDQKFGKIWLLPYNTQKVNTQVTPTAYVWYDELIISTARIADPAPFGAPINPILSSLSPTGGNQGTSPTLTLNGTGFSAGSASVSLTKSGGSGVTAGSINVVNDTTITIPLTITGAATLGPWDVTVTTVDGTSAAQTFTVTTPQTYAPIGRSVIRMRRR